jgi:kynurenine formamidase
MKSNLVDLSHVLHDGMVTFPGLPAPRITDHLTREESRSHYAPGTEFHIGKIEMVASTGTYLDAPFHRWAEGLDVADLPLSSSANLDGIVIRPGDDIKAINTSFFKGLDLKNRAVLVQTGWSTHWGTQQYYENLPFLTKDAAEHLTNTGAALVGIDSLNIDDMNDPTRPVHSILLNNKIPIVENLTNLDQLPSDGFRFFAAPVKTRALGSFPVRAFAIIDS